MTSAKTDSEHPPRRRWLWIVLAVIGLGLAVASVMLLEDPIDVEDADTAPALAPVSVTEVQAVTAQAETRTFAQIRPLWSADLRASVSGTVREVSDKALAGRRVSKGDVLVRIEDTGLRANLRNAEQLLAQQELALLRAQNETELRRKQAQRGGIANPSDLSLLIPDLKVAEKSVAAAQAAVEAARSDLDLAEIRAPFDGVITGRSASPGQSVAPGDPLLSIVDRTRFELETGVSEQQWALLPRPVTDLSADVLSLAGKKLATARVRDAGGFRDAETREFKLFLEVARPEGNGADEQLLTGDLVQLSFAGRAVDDTLTLPESAVTRDGFVWHVDDENRLQRFDAIVLWQNEGTVTVRAPETGQRYRVALTPLAGFLPGMQVDPVDGEGA